MSNLRDRLKKISSEKRAAPAAEASKCAACQSRTNFLEAPDMDFPAADVFSLLGGEDFKNTAPHPEEWIFLDTETTGLSGGVGTIAFEIGVGEWIAGKLKITQLWMRDYDQEEDMLLRLAALFQNKKAIVTFNGKSYDLPLLISRCTLHRIPTPWCNLPHLDLLHPSRRLYKLRLKQCSLSHLEETVLGFERESDIPGSEIPAIWANFIRTKNERMLLDVFDHNLQDVQSMAYLLRKLYDAHARPSAQMHMEDLFSLGRVYDRAGRTDAAEQCYVSIESGACRGMAGRALTRIYRRSKRLDEAIRLLEKMIFEDSGGIFPYVELAKIYEHRCCDPLRALQYTDMALSKTMNKAELEELTKRRLRLAARMKRKA